MRKVDLKQIKQIRKKRNSEIIKRMNAGDSLQRFDSHASWFPQRPIIKKDPKAIKQLYKVDEGQIAASNKESKLCSFEISSQIMDSHQKHPSHDSNASQQSLEPATPQN